MHQKDIICCSISYSVVYPVCMGRIAFAKAGIDNLGTVVHSISYRKCNVFVVFISIGNSPNDHQFDVFSNANRLASDNTTHMGSVIRIGSFRTLNTPIPIVAIVEIIRVVPNNRTPFEVRVVMVF